MKILKKVKQAEGKRQIFIFGIKLFSYKRKKKLPVTTPSFQQMNYGKVYFPHYNQFVMPPNNEPDIYDKQGNKLHTFFLRDLHLVADPTHQSKYFIWDKFNFGLDIHFYSHEAMLETMGKPKHKFGCLIESEAIVPKDYTIFERYPNLYKQFDYIFTYSSKILDTVPNARFVPFASGIWGEICHPDLYKNKNKICSFISTDKHMCNLHNFRFNLAHKCKNEKLCDTFGTFDGGPRIKNLSDTYKNYMFCICIENAVNKFYFSERLTTALANQCIPIYLGATEIDRFFNPDGIIKITTESDIKEVLKQCTPEEYQKRLPAVLDNYERAKKYINPWDYIYEKYIQDMIGDKK